MHLAMKSRFAATVAAVGLLMSGPAGLARAAGAEVKKVDPEKILKEEAKQKKKKKKKKDGWFPTVKAGFNAAVSQSQGVVGVPDGTTLALGLQFFGGLTFRHGFHEWTSRLEIIHTQTNVPNIKPFIKAADKLDLESLYIFHFKRLAWLAVYGGLRLTMPLMEGNFVPENDTNLELTDKDGNVTNAVAFGQQPYRLNKGFSPLVFRQLLGALFLPFTRPYLSIAARIGPTAWEVFTREGYLKNDNKDTADLLELKQLEDHVQIGGEIQVALQGVVLDKILNYALRAEVMYPFYTSVDTDLDKAEMFNVEIAFNLGIKLWKWASIKYVLSVIRQPMILDEWQVINNLMLSVTASWVK